MLYLALVPIIESLCIFMILFLACGIRVRERKTGRAIGADHLTGLLILWHLPLFLVFVWHFDCGRGGLMSRKRGLPVKGGRVRDEWFFLSKSVKFLLYLTPLDRESPPSAHRSV